MTVAPRTRRRDGQLQCLRVMEATYDRLLTLVGRLDFPAEARAGMRDLLPPIERHLLAADYFPESDGPLLG